MVRVGFGFGANIKNLKGVIRTLTLTLALTLTLTLTLILTFTLTLTLTLTITPSLIGLLNKFQLGKVMITYRVSVRISMGYRVGGRERVWDRLKSDSHGEG